MKIRITAILSILLLVLIGLVAWSSPAQAVTCSDSYKVSKDTGSKVFLNTNYQFTIKVRLNYVHCYSITQHYDKLKNYKVRLVQHEDTHCASGFREWRVNIHPLAGTNPATMTLDCSSGQTSYGKGYDLDNQIVGNGADDRCYNFNWVMDWAFEGDKEGTGQSRCLG